MTIPAGKQAIGAGPPQMKEPAIRADQPHNPTHQAAAAVAITRNDEAATADLVERARRGDRDAYGVLVERYASLVYRLVWMRVRDADAAQDIAQEAFLKGWLHLDRLRRPESFGPWLAGIARNESRQHARRQSREPASLDEMTEQHHPAAMSAASNPPDPVEAERRTAVARAMQALPPLYREIMTLRYADDLSYNRLAEFLGVTMGVVKTRLSRGRHLLIKRLKREGHL